MTFTYLEDWFVLAYPSGNSRA